LLEELFLKNNVRAHRSAARAGRLPAASGRNFSFVAMPKGLECAKVLRDPEAIAKLLAFAEADFSAENIKFWIDVAAFLQKCDSQPAEWQQTRAQEIYDMYLKNGAPEQVCFTPEVLRGVESSMSSAGKATFENVFVLAERAINEDIFQRFCDSDPGQKLTSNTKLLYG
jgi:hypothetical protein